MLNQTWSRALACIGAVVGAGFASGREVMVFFSQYGWFSWPLILFSTGLMCMICSLVMRKTRAYSCSHWCSIYQGRSKRIHWLGEGCVFLLMGVTGGAMVSASGNLVALALPIQHAYWVGVITTLLLSYFLTQQNLKPLALLSAFLTLGILASYVLILAYRKEPMVTVNIREPLTLAGGVKAVLFSAAYSGMNMAISLGVVCKCAQTKTRTICRSSLAFGLVLTGLLFISNHVLLQYGDLQDATFPIVRLLSSLGQSGFWISLVVLYLAVFTTLTAILCTLRNMALSHHLSAPSIPVLTLGVPLLFSLIGFEQIVESVYAPVGLACLLLIFIPTILRRPFRQKN
ncbi:MAG: hypothetical protein GXY67_00465 [Clostridiales bacterium]|nr:hypothetical protein [Clostridiales bacterium]